MSITRFAALAFWCLLRQTRLDIKGEEKENTEMPASEAEG